MRGRYLVKQGDTVLLESDNVITTEGREAVLRYLAGEIGQWALSMVFGSGSAPATTTDRQLQFEFYRAPIVFRTADVSTSEVVLRAELPPSVAGKVHEIGLWSTDVHVQSEGPSHVISRFSTLDEYIEGDTDGHWVVTDGGRIGGNALLVNGPGAAIVGYPHTSLDLSSYQSNDAFSLAYIATGNTSSSVEVRFYTTPADYYSYFFSPSGANGSYNIHRFLFADLVVTGNPSLMDIAGFEFRVSNSGGRSIIFDGFRIDDTDAYNAFSFVSRTVLPGPLETFIDEDTYVEYRFEVF